MKPPRVYTRGILHFSCEIRRNTLLRASAFADRSRLWPTKVGGSAMRIHPQTYASGLLQRRIILARNFSGAHKHFREKQVLRECNLNIASLIF